MPVHQPPGGVKKALVAYIEGILRAEWREGSMVARKGAGFQRPWLHSGRIRGGITQLPGDATAVIGCWTWVKRAFILPILNDFISVTLIFATHSR
jgi:hypothetical protein